MKAAGKGRTSEDEVKGKPRPLPGTYHFNINHVNDSCAKKDGSPLAAVVVALEVLAGSPPGQEGKTYSYWINLDENCEPTPEAIERWSRLCLACGVAVNEDRDVPGSELEGCQVIAKVEESIKDGKVYMNIAEYGMGIWGVDNPAVASVPKNLEAIRIWKESRGQSGSGANGNGRATTQANGNGQTTQAAATPPVVNGVDDL
jgi:hypothetical protein